VINTYRTRLQLCPDHVTKDPFRSISSRPWSATAQQCWYTLVLYVWLQIWQCLWATRYCWKWFSFCQLLHGLLGKDNSPP